MSHAYGRALFSDGLVLHFEYNGTGGFAYTALRSSVDEVRAHWRDEEDRACSCGRSAESVRLATSYGGGFTWSGLACRRCLAITDRGAPLEAEDKQYADGLPAWWS